MSTHGRRLVQRNRNPDQSSPALRTQSRVSEVQSQQSTPLPEYEPPSFPLSASAKAKLENLRVQNGTAKYKKHIETVVTLLQVATTEGHERVHDRKEKVEKFDARRKNQKMENDEEISEQYRQMVEYASGLETQVDKLTDLAEVAMRDMVDYSDELAMQDTIMKDIIENITDADAAQPRRRRRDDNEDDEPEEDASADEVEVTSTVELLRKIKEDYATTYASKTMRARYAENNQYKRFKQGIHEASNQGDNAPDMPHARTWFDEETGQSNTSRARRRQNNTTNNANNGDDDDDIQIAGASETLKCPLTIQYFREPYSNKLCKHIFEKAAIIEYIELQGTVFVSSTSHGGPRIGYKQVKCPQTGCEQMLALKDFEDDALTLKKVQRRKRAEREAANQDDDPDDHAPRGTQRNRPENIDDDDSDGVDVEEQDRLEKRSKEIARIKRERYQSRAPSVAPRRNAEGDVDMEDDA